jgi:hypothetical protein
MRDEALDRSAVARDFDEEADGFGGVPAPPA